MNNTFREIAAALFNAEKILLLPHVGIDGDAVGSCVALAKALRKSGKQVYALYSEGIPSNLEFLITDENGVPYFTDDPYILAGGETNRPHTAGEECFFGADLAAAVDCGSYDRFKDYKDVFLSAPSTLIIDHHGTSLIEDENGETGSIADMYIIDPSVAACGELIYGVLKELEALRIEALKHEGLKSEALNPEALKPEGFWPETLNPESLKPETINPESLKPETFNPESHRPEAEEDGRTVGCEKPLIPDKEIANALFAAITTDTGNFQYSNTTAKTHEITAELYKWGVEANRVSVEIYESERSQAVRIRNLALSRVEMVGEGRGAVSYVTKDDIDQIGVKPGETDPIVNAMRTVKSVEYVAFLKEKEKNVIRVSLRAKAKGNVAEIALLHNGGGHVKAAGCTLYMPIAEAVSVIKKDLEEALDRLPKE